MNRRDRNRLILDIFIVVLMVSITVTIISEIFKGLIGD